MFEAPQEKFNERRVHLLKSQLSLLERQVHNIHITHSGAEMLRVPWCVMCVCGVLCGWVWVLWVWVWVWVLCLMCVCVLKVVVQSQALQSRSHLLSDLASLLDTILDHRDSGSKTDRGGVREKGIDTERERGEEGSRGGKTENPSSFSEVEMAVLLERARGLRVGISRCGSVSPTSLPLPHLPPSLLVQRAASDEAVSEGFSSSDQSTKLDLRYVVSH